MAIEVDHALAEALADGPVPKAQLQERLGQIGVTAKQLRCARERLGVIVRRQGSGARMHSTWELSSSRGGNTAIRALAPEMATPLREPKVCATSSSVNLNAGEAARMAIRIERLQMRGLSEADAATLATALVVDRDRPGLRTASCAECQSFIAGGRCATASYTGGARDPLELWSCSWCRRDLP